MDLIQFRYGDTGDLIEFKECPKLSDKQYFLVCQYQQYRFSKLFETIQKEINISKESLVILDEKGVDYSSCNPDDILSSKLKGLSDKMTVIYLFNDQRDTEIQKYFDEFKNLQASSINHLSINNGLIQADIEENYNFKPIYAVSSLLGNVDITSIQTFEQQFFNDYSQIKRAYQKFKFKIRRGYEALKNLDHQNICLEASNKSIKATYDQMYQMKQNMKITSQKLYQANLEILKTYKESLDEIKKYQLHSVLQKDGKKYLSDIYYDESQMNKWRDTCAKSNESLKIKIEKFDREFSSVRDRINLFENSSDAQIDEAKQRELTKQLENIIQEVEPLMLSILTTVFDDLKEMHSHLNKICQSDPTREEIRAAQSYLTNIDQFKRKIRDHQDLQLRMEEHSKTLEKVLDNIQSIRQKNANVIIKICQKNLLQRKELKKSQITFDSIKVLTDNLARVEKDFQYLKQPSELPRVYERSLVEVQRRRRFRKLIDDEVSRIQKFIQKEKEFRVMYKNECSKKKPTDFLPQLDEQIPILRLEGGNYDYNLPEIEDLSLSEFDDFFNLLGEVNSNKNQGDASEYQVKYKSLLKEVELLKDEHKSNIKDLNEKIDSQEANLQMKNLIVKDYMNKITLKEKDLIKLRDDLEKLNKTLKDTSLQHSQSLRLAEEGLQRKQKEFDALARTKNCKGCIICTEDAKDKQDQSLIKQLNDSLVDKTVRINSLEEQLRKSSALINQVCQHNFSFLRQKTQDFYKAQEKTKSHYENRLMEVEELLGLEKKRCEDVIKTRVAILEEKYLKSQSREQEHTKKIKELNFQFQNQDKEVKSHMTKIKEYQNQIQKLQMESIKAAQDRKSAEDQSKKMENQFMEENKKVLELQKKLLLERNQQQDVQKLQQDLDKKNQQIKEQWEDQLVQIKKLTTQRDELQIRLQEAQDEKSRIDDKFKKEQSTLTKQLKELRENYEKEIRDKNEKILYLNNTINEHLDKQSDFSKQSAMSTELYEKQKRDIQTKSKDLQEITSLLQKKSAEVLKLQQETDKIKNENQQLISQIQNLQKSIENQNKENHSPQDIEIANLKKKLLMIEEENKSQSQKQDYQESTLSKIKEFSAITCNLKDNEKWESNIAKILYASQHECINFMSAEEGIRVLFMPHSQGIYLAMVLKEQEEILRDMLKEKDINSLFEESSMKSSQQQPPVKKLNIRNNLFLDIKSLSKNMQTILENYQMIVIARIKSISQHKASEINPYELESSEIFFHCQIEKLEHIVGFENDDFVISDYVCK